MTDASADPPAPPPIVLELIPEGMLAGYLPRVPDNTYDVMNLSQLAAFVGMQDEEVLFLAALEESGLEEAHPALRARLHALRRYMLAAAAWGDDWLMADCTGNTAWDYDCSAGILESDEILLSKIAALRAYVKAMGWLGDLP